VDPGVIAQVLQTQRQELVSELAALTAVTRDPAATIGFGKRVGEGTSEAIGRIERVGQADVLAAKLADVERALEKLDEGTYGVCDACGSPIGPERLEAIPWTALCVRCASERR
jgi:DnaK suppressor protein